MQKFRFFKSSTKQVLTDRRLMEQEASVLLRLMEKPHPNIISFYGSYHHASESGSGSYFLVLSRCVMSLRDIVEKKVFLFEFLFSFFFSSSFFFAGFHKRAKRTVRKGSRQRNHHHETDLVKKWKTRCFV
jgi:hypothetical protein